MREDFLHYVWKNRKFKSFDFKCVDGESISVIDPGQYLKLAGPDFFNAQIFIGKQKWAGNIEIHLKSSDWYLHNHESDPAYENVILHVVWEHDIDIFRKDNSAIPVLELKNYISTSDIERYSSLTEAKSWIYCEKQISSVLPLAIRNWMDRLFLERLECKSLPIIEYAKENTNDWEEVLFWLLAKNFGLNTNGDCFFKIARAIPFSTIRKERVDVRNIEALLFGRCGMLSDACDDEYYRDLQKRYVRLRSKYNLSEASIPKPEFFKHRPDNFPTIRLAQLAALYHRNSSLFAKISEHDVPDLYGIFAVETSEYWKSHYLFGRSMVHRKKMLSKKFIDLLIINTVIPLRMAYYNAIGKAAGDELIDLATAVQPEQNGIVDKFAEIGIKAINAFESQALLQMKTSYCDLRRCLECGIGLSLLRSGEESS